MWTLALLLTACSSLDIYSLSGSLQAFRISPKRFSATEVPHPSPNYALSVWIKVVSPLTAAHTVLAAHIGEGALLTLSISPETAFQGDMRLENNLLGSTELVRKSTDKWTLLALSVGRGDSGKTLSMCAGIGGIMCVLAALKEQVEFGVSESWDVIVNPMSSPQSEKVLWRIADFRGFRHYEKTEVLIRLLLREQSEIDASEDRGVLQVCRDSVRSCGRWSYEPQSGTQGFVISGSLPQEMTQSSQAVSVLGFTGTKTYKLTVESNSKSQVTACVNGPECKPFCASSKTPASQFTATLCLESAEAYIRLCIQRAEDGKVECNSHLLSREKETFVRLEVDSSHASLLRIKDLTVLSTCGKETHSPTPKGPRRLLAVAHYAMFSYRSYINGGENQYFTFVNNHLLTQYIFFELDNLGSGGDPDLYIEKPYGSGVGWGSSAVGPDSMTISSTDGNIVSQGGSMQGSWTVRVYGYTGGYTYELRITVACAETSTGCYCPLGEYPNPSTASCSVCPVIKPECSQPQNSGCVQITAGTSASANPFNCYRCDPNLYTCTCHRTCSGCQGPGSGDCTACKSSAGLSGGSPSACACNSAFYPDPDAAQCQACNSFCLDCADGSTAGCTTCRGNAHLSSTAPCDCVCNAAFFGSPNSCQSCDHSCAECIGASPTDCSQCYSSASLASTPYGSCDCNTGYFTLTDSSNCQACHASCLTCTGGLTTSCTGCKAHAHLNSVSPSACVCDDGYFPNTTPASCFICDSTCKKCVGASASDCSDCFPNAQLISGSSPDSCTCQDGYYPDSTPANCPKCSSTCLKCSGGLAEDCTACFPHASFFGGSSPGKCVCDTGYFPNPSSAQCALCDVSCLNCVGGGLSQCSECKASAALDGAPGKCLCNSGFFPNPTAGSCTACHPTCKECVTDTANACIECKNFAKLSAAAPSSCYCSPESFASPDASNCKVCALECLTCTEDGPTKCLSCKPGASLTSTPPCECRCDSGYFPSPDPSLCIPCSPTCKKCASGTECIECKTHASLKGDTCLCDNGYFGNPDASNCLQCAEGCISCDITKCEKCKPDWFIWTGSCVSSCPYGYKADANSECQSVDLNPPVPSLTVTEDNTLSVYFDKPMNCTIEASEVNVDVISTGGVEVSLTWSAPQFQSSQTLLIHLIFESDYLPSGSEAALQFLAQEKVVDEYSIAIEVTRLTGKLTPFGSSRSNSTGVLLQTSAAQQTAAASRGGVSAGAASSLLNGNPACLMSLVNQLQLITYISMSKLPLPSDFASTLAALNVGQMIPISLGDYMPKLDSNDTLQQPPQYVNDYGIGTLLFLPNSVTFLGTVCAILLSFVPIYMLSRVKIKFIADYFKAMLPSLKWNVPLQLWLTSYLDMGVFGLLQVANAKNSFVNAYTGVNFIVGCVFCISFAATPVFLLLFILRNFNLISSRCDPAFNRRWGSLYLPFKSDYTLASVAYYLLFVLRRVVLAATLVLFPDSLVTLALLNTVCALTVTPTQVFLYIAVCRPFTETIDFVDSVTVEASTFAVYLTASGFLLSLSDKLRGALTVAGIWLVRVTIFANVGVSVTRTVLNVTGLVKAYRDRIQEVKAKYEVRRIERVSKLGEVSDVTDTRSTANWLAT